MEQGSTPDKQAGGLQPSLPSSADNAAPQAQPSTPQDNQPTPGADLLGSLQQRIETGEPATETPSQPTPEPTPVPQPTPQNPGQQPAGDSTDDELIRWASSQGIDLNNPTAEQMKKVAQRLRDTQKWAHERANNNQQLQQANQAINDDSDPLETEVRALRAENARRDFWEQHPEDRSLESKMTAYVLDLANKYEQTGDPSFKAGAQFYMTPQGWESLLQVVKAQGGFVDQIRDEAAEAAARAERENLARAQQAAAPNSAALSSAPTPKVSDDEAIARMSQAEYNEWRKSHNPFAV